MSDANTKGSAVTVMLNLIHDNHQSVLFTQPLWLTLIGFIFSSPFSVSHLPYNIKKLLDPVIKNRVSYKNNPNSSDFASQKKKKKV